MKNLLRASALSILLCLGSVSQVRPSIKTKLATGVVLGSIAFIYGKSSYTLLKALAYLRPRAEYNSAWQRLLCPWEYGKDLLCKEGDGQWCQFDDNVAWQGGRQIVLLTNGRGQNLIDVNARGAFDNFLTMLSNRYGKRSGGLSAAIEDEMAFLRSLRWGLSLGECAAFGIRRYARYLAGRLSFYESWLDILDQKIKEREHGSADYHHEDYSETSSRQRSRRTW